MALPACQVVIGQENVKSITPPSAAARAFAKDFPASSKAIWEKEGTAFEVNFYQKEIKISAEYTEKGELLETEVLIKNSDLPASVREYISKQHPGSSIKRAEKLTLPDKQINYEVKVGQKELVFDEGGKFLKEEKD